jgi:hypothetical protein
MLWKFDSVYDPARLARDHTAPCRHAIRPPPDAPQRIVEPASLYVHLPPPSRPRADAPAPSTA